MATGTATPPGPVTDSPSCCQVGASAATGTVTMVLVPGSHWVAAIRALSDTGAHPVGALVCAGKEDGGTDWKVVAKAFVTEPMSSIRTTRDARKAIRALHRAAEALS